MKLTKIDTVLNQNILNEDSLKATIGDKIKNKIANTISRGEAELKLDAVMKKFTAQFEKIEGLNISKKIWTGKLDKVTYEGPICTLRFAPKSRALSINVVFDTSDTDANTFCSKVYFISDIKVKNKNEGNQNLSQPQELNKPITYDDFENINTEAVIVNQACAYITEMIRKTVISKEAEDGKDILVEGAFDRLFAIAASKVSNMVDKAKDKINTLKADHDRKSLIKEIGKKIEKQLAKDDILKGLDISTSYTTNENGSECIFCEINFKELVAFNFIPVDDKVIACMQKDTYGNIWSSSNTDKNELNLFGARLAKCLGVKYSNISYDGESTEENEEPIEQPEVSNNSQENKTDRGRSPKGTYLSNSVNSIINKLEPATRKLLGYRESLELKEADDNSKSQFSDEQLKKAFDGAASNNDKTLLVQLKLAQICGKRAEKDCFEDIVVSADDIESSISDKGFSILTNPILEIIDIIINKLNKQRNGKVSTLLTSELSENPDLSTQIKKLRSKGVTIDFIGDEKFWKDVMAGHSNKYNYNSLISSLSNLSGKNLNDEQVDREKFEELTNKNYDTISDLDSLIHTIIKDGNNYRDITVIKGILNLLGLGKTASQSIKDLDDETIEKISDLLKNNKKVSDSDLASYIVKLYKSKDKDETIKKAFEDLFNALSNKK